MTRTKQAPTAEEVVNLMEDPIALNMTRDVMRLQAAAQDAVVDTRRLTATVVTNDYEEMPIHDRVVLKAATPQGAIRLALLEGAHRQLADKTGIPYKYYERMLTGAPDLLATNVNNWLASEPDRRLLRMLKPLSDSDHERLTRLDATFNVRAVLGERYRPLDHASLLNTLLPVAHEFGARVKEYELNDQKFFLRFIGQEQEVNDIVERLMQEHRLTREQVRGHHRVEGRDVSWVNEVLRAGVAVRNSETGHGALAVERFFDVLRCVNGYIMHNQTRVRHVGGRNEETENILGADTRRLDDAAVFLKVRDETRALFASKTAEDATVQIAKAAGDAIELPTEVPLLEFVSNVGRKLDLSDGEVEILKEEVLEEKGKTGAFNRWTMAQGLTATARRVGQGVEDRQGRFGRKAAIEEAGWQVLEDTVGKLLKAGGVK